MKKEQMMLCLDTTDEPLKLTVLDDLCLKTRQLSDAEQLFALVDKNRDYLRPWLLWVDESRSPEDSKKYIEECLEALEKKTKIDFGIWLQGTLVGSVGVFDISEQNRSAEIGYWLGEEYTGKGIMTKCVSRLVDYGFGELNLNRIRIRCVPENIQSANIPKRLGFTYEGTHRQSQWMYDKFLDDAVYGLLKSEWRQ